MRVRRRRGATDSGRHSGSAALALSALLILAACTTPVVPVTPSVEMPARFETSPSVAKERAPRLTVDWWQAFGSVELDRLMNRAMDNNQDLAAAAARLTQARALVAQAGAARLPALTLSADSVSSHRRDAGTDRHRELGLGLSVDPDLWGQNRELERAALGRALAGEHARQALRLGLQAELAGSYFAWLSARDRLQAAQASLKTAESLLALMRTQHRAGAISGLEVSRQQGLVASVKASLPPIEQEALQVRLAIAVLTGDTPQGFAISGMRLADLVLPAVAPGLPSALLTRRPDLRQIEAELQAAQADVQAVRAAFFPRIALSASAGAQSASLAGLLRSGSLVQALAGALIAPLFDGGRRHAQSQQAQARQLELVHLYRQAILQALREVDETLSAGERLAEQAAHQQEVIEQARSVLDKAQLRYRQGATDFATVLDAQRVLLAAEAAGESIRLARFSSAIRLVKALGGGQADSSEPHTVPASARLTAP